VLLRQRQCFILARKAVNARAIIGSWCLMEWVLMLAI